MEKEDSQKATIIIEDSPIPLDFELYWFNTDQYGSFVKEPSKLFSAQQGDKQACVRFFVLKDGKEWVSPYRAPFGGMEFSVTADKQFLFEFLKELVALAKERGVKKITMVAPPECYHIDKADMMDDVLLHSGFEATVTELNYHLTIEDNSFENILHDSEKRRLAKCVKAEFVWAKESNPDFASVHELIVKCRARKGYPLSMDLEDFKLMFERFPKQYEVYTVKDKEVLIAVSIGVKVGNGILYNFLPADHEAYLNYSPMVMLTKGIYDYCKANHFSIYDLGIATAQGVLNEGLMKFKEHIGGKLSHKYTYEISL